MRKRRWHGAVGLAFASWAVCALLVAEPAMAVRPQPGSFIGFPANFGAADFVDAVDVTSVRVSRSGRSFSATTLATCGIRMRVSGRSGPAHAVPIRRDGRFAAVARDGPVRYRVRGRFLAGDHARITVARRAARCGGIVLYRNGVPPFSGCRSQPAASPFSSETGRVFHQLVQRPGVRSFSVHAYVCLFDSPSTRIDLGEDYAPDDYRENFRITGPFVAFFRTGCAMCTWPQRYIEVRDARDGSLASRPEVEFWTRLSDLELKANGSVAWTFERLALAPEGYPVGYPTQPPVVENREVWALDSNGQRLLDSGQDVVVDSLELNGSTLYWLNGTTAHSAALN